MLRSINISITVTNRMQNNHECMNSNPIHSVYKDSCPFAYLYFCVCVSMNVLIMFIYMNFIFSVSGESLQETGFNLGPNLIGTKVVVMMKLIPIIPDSKVHGTYMGPTWGRQDPGGPHVGPMILAIWNGITCGKRSEYVIYMLFVSRD